MKYIISWAIMSFTSFQYNIKTYQRVKYNDQYGRKYDSINVIRTTILDTSDVFTERCWSCHRIYSSNESADAYAFYREISSVVNKSNGTMSGTNIDSRYTLFLFHQINNVRDSSYQRTHWENAIMNIKFDSVKD